MATYSAGAELELGVPRGRLMIGRLRFFWFSAVAANVDAMIARRFGHGVAEFFDGANVTLHRVQAVPGSLALD